MSLNVFFVLFRLLCPENQHQVRVRVRNVGCCCSVQDNVHVVQCDRGNKLKLAATELELQTPRHAVVNVTSAIRVKTSCCHHQRRIYSMYLAEPTVWSLSLS